MKAAYATKQSFGYFRISCSSVDELLFMIRPKITYRNTVMRVSVPSESGTTPRQEHLTNSAVRFYPLL